MRFTILTLHPDMFVPLRTSIIGRAVSAGIVDIQIIDIRDYSKDKHRRCDDYPYGGGAGMVMTVQPVYDAINAIDPERKAHRVYMSPKGERLTQTKVKELGMGTVEHMIILCGHYEGVDERIIELCIDSQISIGDYVLTGGEIPAMVLVDSVTRLLPGVLAEGSAEDESFSDGKLEYPHYTRPQDFLGHKVPQILVSGNHANVAEWRESMRRDADRKSR